MRTVLIPLFVLGCLSVFITAHAEKKVYKCTNSDGSVVFSPYLCGASAQEMKVETVAPPPAAAPGVKPSEAPQVVAPSPVPPPQSADDVKCRQDAERLRTYPSEANLNMLMQRQAELMRSYSASESESIKVQIGNLDATIATEQTRLSDARQHADRAFADAITKCDARKAAADSKAAHP